MVRPERSYPEISRVKALGSDEDGNADDLDLPIRLGFGGEKSVFLCHGIEAHVFQI